MHREMMFIVDDIEQLMAMENGWIVVCIILLMCIFMYGWGFQLRELNKLHKRIKQMSTEVVQAYNEGVQEGRTRPANYGFAGRIRSIDIETRAVKLTNGRVHSR